MTSILEPVKDILGNFINSFSEARACIQEPAFFWEKEEAYAWIYGARRYIPLMHRMNQIRPLPSFYSQVAKPLFDKWLELFLDIQNFHAYHIPHPLKNETLYQYLERIHSIVISRKERRTIWWDSLRSFTHFLRDQAKQRIENLGELDVIFPEDMTIYSDTIIRKVPVTLYPIDVWAAAEILQNLCRIALEGRPNAQESAAQALGLAWVCLASSHARFMTRLEILHELPINSVKKIPQNDLLQPNHGLTIPTFFGNSNAPVSETVHNYLLALHRANPRYIFNQPLRTLRRTLDRAIAASPQAQGLGKITFLTLMYQPHEARGHRFKGYGNLLDKTL